MYIYINNCTSSVTKKQIRLTTKWFNNKHMQPIMRFVENENILTERISYFYIVLMPLTAIENLSASMTSRHHDLTSWHNDLTSRHNYWKVDFSYNYVDLSDVMSTCQTILSTCQIMMSTCQIILLFSVWH